MSCDQGHSVVENAPILNEEYASGKAAGESLEAAHPDATGLQGQMQRVRVDQENTPLGALDPRGV